MNGYWFLQKTHNHQSLSKTGQGNNVPVPSLQILNESGQFGNDEIPLQDSRKSLRSPPYCSASLSDALSGSHIMTRIPSPVRLLDTLSARVCSSTSTSPKTTSSWSAGISEFSLHFLPATFAITRGDMFGPPPLFSSLLPPPSPQPGAQQHTLIYAARPHWYGGQTVA